MPKKKADYIFLFSAMTLSAIGLLMVFSASPTMGLKLGDAFYFIKRHVLYLLLGFAGLYFAASLDLGKLRKRSGLILIISVLLLLAVFIPGVGRKISGASRWIELGILSFQPSELIKLALIIYLADLLSKPGNKLKDFMRGLLPVLLLLAVITAVIVKQPDLGTALTVMATALIMLFAAGAQTPHMLGILGFALAAVAAISVTSPYRMRRLVAYLDPWKDPQGKGFQIIQSLLAIGSGGALGMGLGASRQKFFYLPQQFTDFIFAILCEELGFAGGVAVVLLFVIFAVRGLRIAFLSEDPFKYLLATGLVSWLTLQAAMNIMVVVGLVPTTGIPLPFISYGGTATIVNLFAVGLVLKISGEGA